MADETTVEKHYCYPCASGDNSSINPMLSALLTNQNGGNQMWSNPFVYLVWMMFANRFGFGADGTSSGENTNSRAIAALQDTVNTNHNNDLVMQAMSNNQSAIRELAQTFNTDINSIQMAIGGVQNAITQVAGQIGMSGQQVINSVLLGNKDLLSQLQTCCCENKMLAMQNQSANQLGQFQMQSALGNQINDTRNAMVNGFAQVGYATQQQTNEIVQASNANTQRILDQMCSNNTQELRDKLAEMSQEAQTAKILASVNGTSTNSIW